MAKTYNRQLAPGRVLIDVANKNIKMFVIVGISYTDACMLHVYDARKMESLPPQKSVALGTTLPPAIDLEITYPMYCDYTSTVIASLASLSEKVAKEKTKLLGKIDRRDLNMLINTLRSSETIPLSILQQFFAAY